MTQYKAGMDALNALNASDQGAEKNEFNSFKTGVSYKVRAYPAALITFYSYGIYGKVNSFTAAQPSKKSAKGYPVENLTPWDRAWKYHKDLSEDFSDAHGQEAGKYRAKQRFALGFYDLTSGENIVVDLSKNQAQAVMGVITKSEKRLDKLAFELSKSGSGKSTIVSLTPITFPDEDLSDEERKNFASAPAEFDMARFDGILFEADEAEQIKLLQQAGFNPVLIGLEAQAETPPAASADDIDEEALPF